MVRARSQDPFHRLTQLYSTLSGTERASLAHRAWKSGNPSRSFYDDVPPSQASEFWRLVGLARAANAGLGWLAAVCEQQVERCSLCLGWCASAMLISAPSDGHPNLNSDGLTPLQISLATRMRSELNETYGRLRAIEACATFIGEELAGEDPLHPEFRETLDALLNRVKDIHSHASNLIGEFGLEEPSESALADVETIILQAVHR